MDVCHLQEIHPGKYGKKLIDTTTKTGLDAAKTTSKRRVHKAPNLMGNKFLKKL